MNESKAIQMLESLYAFWVEPITEFLFLKRALVAVFVLSIGSAPIGVLLILRRMSLMGDALSHAILPGIAIGFWVAGFSLTAMTIGGLGAGTVLAILAGIVTRKTKLKEDATFAGFFILSLALGVMLVSLKGSNINLMHVLFGNVLALNKESLVLIGIMTSLTLITLSIIYRPLIIDSFDGGFLRVVSKSGGIYHILFLILVVMNLVSSFQSLGTLLALGLMMLPAISAKLWSNHIGHLFLLSIFFALSSGYLGLILSYHFNLPTGPLIILMAGVFYIFSIFFGRDGGIFRFVLAR